MTVKALSITKQINSQIVSVSARTDRSLGRGRLRSLRRDAIRVVWLLGKLLMLPFAEYLQISRLFYSRTYLRRRDVKGILIGGLEVSHREPLSLDVQSRFYIKQVEYPMLGQQVRKILA